MSRSRFRLPPIRSSLPQATSIDYGAIKKNVFHDDHILVVNLDDPMLNWSDRELLKTIGERIYGKLRSPQRLVNGRAR